MLARIGKTLLSPTAVASIVLGVLGVVFAAGGLRLGLWLDGGPGPGLLPAAAAVLMLVLLGATLWSWPKVEESFKPEPLAAIAICGLYAVLAPRIGFLVPTIALVVAWVKLLHGQTWLSAILVGFGITGICIAVFSFLLSVPMPLLVGLP